MASFWGFPPATLRSKYALPSVTLRSWTTAIMCNALLIWRLPPRESRWRTLLRLVAKGRVDGGGSGPGREVALGREPGDVTDLDQQPRRPGWADAVQVEQPGSGGST